VTPVVALAATAGEARSLVPFLSLVGSGGRIVSWHRRGAAGVDAVVASDPGMLAQIAPALAESKVGRGEVPTVACRVRSAGDFAAARELSATVTFTDVAELAGPDGPLGDVEPLLVPEHGIDLGRYPVIPPLSRQRMREAHGLPDPLVLAVDASAPPRSSSTSLALASAAVVDLALLPLALALGTPTVVDVDAASRFGLTDGVEVLVAATADLNAADRLAATLARDEERCAALSRRARRFAERHLDVAGPASAVRRALGLEPEPSLIDLRLEEVRTPEWSRLTDRAHHALALFTMEPSR